MSESLILPEIGEYVHVTPKIRRYAKSFSLLEKPCLATREKPDLYDGVRMMDLLGRWYRHVPEPVRVWAAQDADEAVRTNQEIYRPKRGDWNFFSHTADQMDDLNIYASRTDGTVEGVLAGGRSLFVDDWVSYYLSIDFIYVTPKARRKSVAAALKTCITEIACSDLDRVVEIGRANRRKVPIHVVVLADIHSKGGERAVEDIYDAIERHCGFSFEDYPIECEPDWGW